MKTKATSYPAAQVSEPAVLKELAAAPGIGPSISIRAAKAHLSALLELVAGGQEITITSDGEPKAVLSPVGKHKARKVFTGTRDHLKQMPGWSGGLRSEEIVRADRDGRA